MCVSGERRGGGGDIKIRFDLRAIQRIHSGFALLYARVCVFACAIQERALVTVTTLLRSGDIFDCLCDSAQERLLHAFEAAVRDDLTQRLQRSMQSQAAQMSSHGAGGVNDNGSSNNGSSSNNNNNNNNSSNKGGGSTQAAPAAPPGEQQHGAEATAAVGVLPSLLEDARHAFASMVRVVLSVSEADLGVLQHRLEMSKAVDMVNTVHAYPWPTEALAAVVQKALLDEERKHATGPTAELLEEEARARRESEARLLGIALAGTKGSSSDGDGDGSDGHNDDDDDDAMSMGSEMVAGYDNLPNRAQTSKFATRVAALPVTAALDHALADRLSQTILTMIIHFLETCGSCGYNELAGIFESLQTIFLKRAAREFCSLRRQKTTEYLLTRHRLTHACTCISRVCHCLRS